MSTVGHSTLARIARAGISAIGVLALVGIISGACGASGGSSHARTLYVSSEGRDTNSCKRSKPCASFQRAYVAARPGEVVLVEGGSYADQTLTPDPKKKSPGVVVFRPADPAAVKVNSVVIEASHVRFENFNFGPAVINGGSTPSYGFGLQIGVEGGAASHYACTTDVSIIGGSGHAFSIQNGVSDVRIVGGRWGDYGWQRGQKSDGRTTWEDSSFGFDPSKHCPTAATQAAPLRNVLIQGVTFGNIFQGCVTLGQECAAPSHPDCTQISGSVNGIDFRNNVFRGCFGTYVHADAEPGVGPISNVTYENNYFGDAAPSAAHVVMFSGGGSVTCNNVVFRRNTFAYTGAGFNLSCPPRPGQRGIEFERNIIAVGWRTPCPTGAPFFVRFVDNIFLKDQSCGTVAHAAPYGYRSRGGKLETDPRLAPAIKQIFTLAGAGWKAGRIAAAVRTPGVRGGGGVKRLVADRSYLSNWYGSQGSLRPLVARGLWIRAQRILAQ